MAEEQLRESIYNEVRWLGNSEGGQPDMDEIMAYVYGYAAAQVAAKDAEIAEYKEARECLKVATDAEIARLQIEVENLKSYQQSLECDNFHANAHADTFEAEVKSLKADNARKLEMQDTMHANAEAALREENKRLREGVRKALKYIEGPHHSNPEPIAIYEILQPLISPSDGYMKSICTTCELTIEECECYFDSDDDANTHTKRVPSDGDGAKNNKNNEL